MFLISLNTVQYKKKSFPSYPSSISEFDSDILNFPSSLSCQHLNGILGELKDSAVISITKHPGWSKTQIFYFKFESFHNAYHWLDLGSEGLDGVGKES